MVERYYCACGAECSIRYRGHFVETHHDEPGAHRRWIEGHERLRAERGRIGDGRVDRSTTR